MQRSACRTLPFLLTVVILLPGCIGYRHEQAFYVSPFNANSGGYHPLPLLADSARTAIYGQAEYFFGVANERRNDHLEGGRGAVYIAHRFGAFQCYGGLDLSLGHYNVGIWDSSAFMPFWAYAPPQQFERLNTYAGSKFFGGTGFSGAVDWSVPLGGGDEWRVIGVETALYREFGDYHDFRAKLPDDLATLNVRDRFYGMAGLTTEIVGKFQDGELGLSLARGWALGRSYNYLNTIDSLHKKLLEYEYFSASCHFTVARITGYAQLDVGTKTAAFRLGLVYRMTRSRLRHFGYGRPYLR